MYAAVLIAHISGAILTGIIGVFAVGAMILKKETVYRRAALVLAALGAFEVLSGTVLAVLSKSISVASVCGNIALYVGAVAFVETLIYMRMRKTAFRFPSIQTISAIGSSLVLFALAGVLGF